MIRSINKKKAPIQDLMHLDFPKERPGVIYVRQSSQAQVNNNIHSYEMQTDKFLEHFRNMGCTGNIEIIADDEGKSGTLSIQDRAGLSRVTRLIEGKELLNGERIGWVGAVHVNRLTRDPWLVVPGVLMKECHQHDVWVATLRMNYNFKDEYCQRVFMLEAEESARHLKWMRLVMGGGKNAASSKGYYDGRYLVPGYIVDRSNPLKKKYVIYEPHAEKVKWLFRRFFELDGNFAELRREVDALPFLFADFESSVDQKNIGKFRIKKEGNGGYKPVGNGLRSILTNPVYLGWWVPENGGLIKNNHDAIIEDALFMFAYEKLSRYTLEGERAKPEKVVRWSKVEALLKNVICSPSGDPIYSVRSAGGSYRKTQYEGLIIKDLFRVPIKVIDEAFLEKFFERLQSTSMDEFSEWEERLEREKENKEERRGLIRKEIKDIENKLQRIITLTLDESTPVSMATEYKSRYKELEVKKIKLETELNTGEEEEEEEAQTLYRIKSLIPDLIQLWDKLPTDQKMRLIGALVHRVTLDHVSSSFMKLEIEWRILEWGVDVGHIRRKSKAAHWSEEELDLLREVYPVGDAGEILELFPKRTWSGIVNKASELVKRERIGYNNLAVSNYRDCSLEDIKYTGEMGLTLSTKEVQWSKQLSKNVGNGWCREAYRILSDISKIA